MKGQDNMTADIARAKRRRVWHIVIGANLVALVAAIAGCLFMAGSQGVQADVARMRDEVGETLTMMSMGGASEAVARHIPKLLDVTARWERKFVAKRESFRGLDAEIDRVQSMTRLGRTAERWRRELEGISPMQRNEFWQKSIKAQVDAEQKKWPNITHQKNASEWMVDLWNECWFGIKHGFTWPVGIYQRTVEVAKGKGSIGRLGIGDRFHYIIFPYRLSAFSALRLTGIALATSAVGYLMCWLGLKSRFGWASYAGLIYFLYLLAIALFIVWLEVTK
jgi:hypothetical protein